MHKRRVGWLSKLLSGVLLAISIGLAFYAWQIKNVFPVNGQTVPYWLYRAAVDDSALMCLSIMPMGLMISIVQVRLWRNRWIKFLLVVITTMLTCTVMLFSTIIILFTFLGTQKHHDTLRTEHHVYHLSSEWKVGVGSASRAAFLLWQCDLPQTACETIYSKYIPPIYPEEEYESAVAELDWNPQTRAVEFILNGEVIYAHPE